MKIASPRAPLTPAVDLRTGGCPVLVAATVLFPHAVAALPAADDLIRTLRADRRESSLLAVAPEGATRWAAGPNAVSARVLAAGDGEVLLRGLQRVRLDRVEGGMSRIAVVADEVSSETIDRSRLRRDLIGRVRDLLPNHAHALQHHWWETQLSLGGLCDVLAEALALSLPKQLQVLKEINVDRRCDLVRRFLETHPLAWTQFPPRFSAN